MATEFHIRMDTHDLSLLGKVIEFIQPKYYVYGKEIAKKTKKEHIHLHVYVNITIQPESWQRKVRENILSTLFEKSSQYSCAKARDSMKSQLYACKDGDFMFSDDFPPEEKENVLNRLEKLNKQKETPYKDQLLNIFKNKISCNSNGHIYCDERNIPVTGAELCNTMYHEINSNRILLGLLPPTHTDSIKYMKFLTIQLDEHLHHYDKKALNKHLFTPFKDSVTF